MKKILYLIAVLLIQPLCGQVRILEVDVFVTDPDDGFTGLFEDSATVPVNTIARVKGHTTPGDGLGGDYRWTGTAWEKVPVPVGTTPAELAAAVAAETTRAQTTENEINADLTALGGALTNEITRVEAQLQPLISGLTADQRAVLLANLGLAPAALDLAPASVRQIRVDVFNSPATDSLTGANEIVTTDLPFGTIVSYLGKTSIGDGLSGIAVWDGSTWVKQPLNGLAPANGLSALPVDGTREVAASGRPYIRENGAWNTDWFSIGGGSGPIYVYATGQSNMARVNYGIPTFDFAPVDGVKIWSDRPANTPNNEWQIWDVAGSSQTLSNASSNPSTTPAFHFAKRLHEQTGREVRVILSAAGGQPLTAFLPNTALYRRLTDAIALSGAPRCDVLIMLQGEAEELGSDAQHNERLALWESAMRDLPTISETTPILLGEVNEQYVNSNRRMREFGRVTPFVTFADGAALLPMLPDGIHFTNDSIVAIGRSVFHNALLKSGVSLPDEPTATVEPSIPLTRATVTTGAQSVRVASGASSQLTGDFTFRARLRPDFLSVQDLIDHGGFGQTILQMGRATTASSAFVITQIQNRTMFISVNDASDRLVFNVPFENIENGETYELAVTWVSATGALTAYVNGVSVGSITTAQIGAQSAITAISALADTNGRFGAKFVTKWMMMHSSVSPLAELQTLSDTLPDSASTSVFAYRFDAPQTDRQFDKSGNGNHGTWSGLGAYFRDIK